MDLTQNYFELFGISEGFTVDTNVLADKYRKLQKDLHPDNFASKGSAEQRLSVQFSAHINTAYQTLKSPLLCAEYLLELAGQPLNSDSLTIDDGVFLYKQMEWRELLSDLSNEVSSSAVGIMEATEQLESLTTEVSGERKELLDTLATCFQQQSFSAAKPIVAKLHFIEKILVDIERLEDTFLDS